jgi:hypothetical protein
LFFRRRFARTFALGWARMSIALFLFGMVAALASDPSEILHRSSLGLSIELVGPANSLCYEFMRMTLPHIFLPIISFLNLGVLIWACYFLTRPPVRDCFSETGQAKSA